jgi:serine/threonine-protein kinase
MAQGKLEEAISEYRTAIRLKPDDARAHCNLGVARKHQGQLDVATAEFRAAIRLQPDLWEAHGELGLVLRAQENYAEAIAELRKARDLVKTIPRIAQWIRNDLAATEQQATVAARLPAVLTGKVRPAHADEILGFAQLCYEKKLHGASARFWTEAFQTQPKLADDMKLQYRYNAACAAALAGCGQGKDQPPLDESAKARWRKQAIDWLRADLTAWSKLLESGPTQARQLVAKTLPHWKTDPDLAGLRDPALLAKLPMSEQAPWRELWSAVDRLLEQTQGRSSK